MNITLDLEFSLTISTSFGKYLFLQGVIRKESKKIHMSNLHRENTTSSNSRII